IPVPTPSALRPITDRAQNTTRPGRQPGWSADTRPNTHPNVCDGGHRRAADLARVRPPIRPPHRENASPTANPFWSSGPDRLSRLRGRSSFAPAVGRRLLVTGTTPVLA